MLCGQKRITEAYKNFITYQNPLYRFETMLVALILLIYCTTVAIYNDMAMF
jgi:hypothetical protein